MMDRSSSGTNRSRRLRVRTFRWIARGLSLACSVMIAGDAVGQDRAGNRTPDVLPHRGVLDPTALPSGDHRVHVRCVDFALIPIDYSPHPAIQFEATLSNPASLFLRAGYLDGRIALRHAPGGGPVHLALSAGWSSHAIPDEAELWSFYRGYTTFAARDWDLTLGCQFGRGVHDLYGDEWHGKESRRAFALFRRHLGHGRTMVIETDHPVANEQFQLYGDHGYLLVTMRWERGPWAFGLGGALLFTRRDPPGGDPTYRVSDIPLVPCLEVSAGL